MKEPQKSGRIIYNLVKYLVININDIHDTSSYLSVP